MPDPAPHPETRSSPHLHTGRRVPHLMVATLFALAPGVIVQALFEGPRVIVHVTIAVVASVVCETLALTLRRRSRREPLLDGSVILTGLLIGICIPAGAPVWIPLVAAAFGVLVGKHVYGGVGQNLFNPAMVGYVMVLVAFPYEMTQWGGGTSAWFAVDGLSGATPLDFVRTTIVVTGSWAPIYEDPSFLQALIPRYWIAGAFALGGFWLCWRGIADWRLASGTLVAIALLSATLGFLRPGQFPDPLTELVLGASVVGAFFIVTDPVTAPSAGWSRWWFGIAIGCLVVIIRRWGSYPDGFGFAVLIMNATVPLWEHWTRRRRGFLASRR
ncbi:MAG: RnfABCDGE type electron transport complex subunit D [Pseudomonadota bacterium]